MSSQPTSESEGHMSCECYNAPICGCDTSCSTGSICMSDNVNDNYQTCTVCDGDKSDPCNVWYVDGICKLDQLTYDQVWCVLSRVPRAKEDLMKITTDPVLLSLARDSRLVSDESDSDITASNLINKGVPGAGTLPFYTVFKGNTDGSVY